MNIIKIAFSASLRLQPRTLHRIGSRTFCKPLALSVLLCSSINSHQSLVYYG